MAGTDFFVVVVVPKCNFGEEKCVGVLESLPV
jgi:hypothetical protein